MWLTTLKSNYYYCSTFLCLSEAIGLGCTWGLPEEAKCLGHTNPRMSIRTPSTLTLVGVPLNDDKSSTEGAVLKGPAELLEAILRGLAGPLEAVL